MGNKEISFGKDFTKGKLSQEMEKFLNDIRTKVDKTFPHAQINPEEASSMMEKNFEQVMNHMKKKKLDEPSFVLGTLFALSRHYWNLAELMKKAEKDKKKQPYVA